MVPFRFCRALSDARPCLSVSIVPTGSDSASSSEMNFFEIGSLTRTLPLTGAALTVLPGTGGRGDGRPSISSGDPGVTAVLPAGLVSGVSDAPVALGEVTVVTPAVGSVVVVAGG